MSLKIDVTTLKAEKQQANQRDIELMRRIGSGDVEAFRTLVDAHRFAVIGTVAKMLGSATEAEDIAQKVFLRVWTSAPGYEPTAQFNTWLYTIVRNLVYNETRRRKRKPTVSLEERAEEFHQVMPDTISILPDKQVLYTEFEEEVDIAIQALPERQRAALNLRIRREMPYMEIARTLSASEPAVKALVFKARTQLRNALRQYLGETPEEFPVASCLD